MTTDLDIDTHLHALRHYSATELLGGGATTLKGYAAWVAGADMECGLGADKRWVESDKCVGEDGNGIEGAEPDKRVAAQRARCTMS
ncbi:MAG: hypothetical protein WCF33_04015 [Pseudonocardiaceae bacterium]